jgi:hypothetical protein
MNKGAEAVAPPLSVMDTVALARVVGNGNAFAEVVVIAKALPNPAATEFGATSAPQFAADTLVKVVCAPIEPIAAEYAIAYKKNV